MRPLLDRSSELDVLDGALHGARSGRGSVTLIEGAAGIGRTKLIDAAEIRARELGLRSARTAGSRPSRDPLGPMITLLRPLLIGSDGELEEPLFVNGASAAARLFRGKGDAPGNLDAAFAVVDALFWLVSDLAEREPLALLVDDLQWTDEVTVELIRRVGEEIGELPVAIVASLRTGEPNAPEFGSVLRGVEELHELQPEPLNDESISALVRDRLGNRTSAALCDACAEATGGNPLLLRELLRAGVDHGLDPGDGPDTIASIEVVALEGLVSDRLGRCSVEASRLALALALLDEGTDAAIVLRATGMDELELTRVAGELEKVELLDDETATAIREPLLARAVIACFTEREIAVMRLAGAKALWDSGQAGRAGAQLAELDELPSDEGGWAFGALLVAAEDASRGGSSREALGYLQKALDGIPAGDERRLAPLLVAARIRAASRDPRAVDDLREALELTADPNERARISLSIGQATFHLGRFVEAAEICRSAIGGLDPKERELRLLLEAEALNADRLRGAGRERPHQLGSEVMGASSVGERAMLTHIAAELVAAGERPCDQVLELARSAWAGGQLIADVGADAPLVSFLGTTLAWCEDFEAVFELTSMQLEAGRSSRAPVTMSYALALRSGTRIRLGDPVGAEADAEQVVAALPASDPLAYMMCFGWLLESQLARGRAEDAAAALAASGLTGELPDLGTVDFLLLSRGDVKLASGDRDAALEDYLEVGVRAERSGYLNPAGLAWRSRAAPLLAEAGDRAGALELARDEVERARRFDAPRALGIGLRALGGCTADESRLSILEESVETLAGSADRLEHARALVDLGVARLQEGETDGARASLEEGMDGAHRAGAHPLVATAMEGLRSLGMRPRRPALRGIDALTSQQLRVARLAAAGRSNREIAEELFLTRRTVELHLTGAYRKLGTDGREGLAGVLAETPRRALPPIPAPMLCLLTSITMKLESLLALPPAAVVAG